MSYRVVSLSTVLLMVVAPLQAGGGAGPWVPIAGRWGGDVSAPAPAVGLFRGDLGFYVLCLDYRGSLDCPCALPPVPAEGGVPLAGDWDGDGVDDIAAYDPATGRFDLFRLDLATGLLKALDTFVWGEPGGVPVAGDWEGDGVDNVGLVRPGEGRAELLDRDGKTIIVPVAQSTELPIAGDWDADGIDTLAFYGAYSHVFTFLDAAGEVVGTLAVVPPAGSVLPFALRLELGGASTPGLYVTSERRFVTYGGVVVRPGTIDKDPPDDVGACS